MQPTRRPAWENSPDSRKTPERAALVAARRKRFGTVKNDCHWAHLLSLAKNCV